MESAQQELICVLLGTVYNGGFLSKAAYLNAMDLVHSALDIPSLFRYPAYLVEGAGQYEYT